MLPRLLALAASAASLAPQPQRALPTTLQRQAATAALAGAVVASPLAAVALSVDVTDINSPPVVDLPVLGRFGVSPSKAKPTVKVSGDLVGTALSAKDGKVKVTVSTPKIGPLPALDDEVLDIRIASSPGTVGVTISNPAIPKLPVGGGTSDWNVVQNLGSGATYYFNSKTGVTQYANPVAPSPKPAKKAAAPAVPAAAPTGGGDGRASSGSRSMLRSTRASLSSSTSVAKRVSASARSRANEPSAHLLAHAGGARRGGAAAGSSTLTPRGASAASAAWLRSPEGSRCTCARGAWWGAQVHLLPYARRRGARGGAQQGGGSCEQGSRRRGARAASC